MADQVNQNEVRFPITSFAPVRDAHLSNLGAITLIESMGQHDGLGACWSFLLSRNRAAQGAGLLPQVGSKAARLAHMSAINRYDRGNNFSGMNAQRSRIDMRRNIIEAVERRLSDLRGADMSAKTGGSKEPDTCKTMKRRRPYRPRTLPRGYMSGANCNTPVRTPWSPQKSAATSASAETSPASVAANGGGCPARAPQSLPQTTRNAFLRTSVHRIIAVDPR